MQLGRCYLVATGNARLPRSSYRRVRGNVSQRTRGFGNGDFGQVREDESGSADRKCITCGCHGAHHVRADEEMKELLIIGIGAFLLYQATRSTVPPGAGTSVNNKPAEVPYGDDMIELPKPHVQQTVQGYPDLIATPAHSSDPSPVGFWPNVGSTWTQRAIDDHLRWVGGIQVAGYPHITGVIHVGTGGGVFDDVTAAHESLHRL